MTILNNTPVWVWVILIFLLAFGVRQLKSRRVHRLQLLIAPTVCLILLLIAAFSATNPVLALLGLTVGSGIGIILGRILFKRSPLLTQESTHWWQQRGSTIPLGIYLYIFATRYLATALPHLPMPILPNFALNIVLGFTGIGVGVLFAIVVFRKTYSLCAQ